MLYVLDDVLWAFSCDWAVSVVPTVSTWSPWSSFHDWCTFVTGRIPVYSAGFAVGRWWCTCENSVSVCFDSMFVEACWSM